MRSKPVVLDVQTVNNIMRGKARTFSKPLPKHIRQGIRFIGSSAASPNDPEAWGWEYYDQPGLYGVLAQGYDGTYADVVSLNLGYSVGELLWVKEPWGQADSNSEEWTYSRGKPVQGRPVLYLADNPTSGADDEYWRSPVSMPRWASRITLKVTSAQAIRLHEISPCMAEANGFTPSKYMEWWDALHEHKGLGTNTKPWAVVVGFAWNTPDAKLSANSGEGDATVGYV